MNNFLSTTLISWETRNWRHAKLARIWCQNYGLKPITQQLFIGELFTLERKKLISTLQKIFIKKTEIFFIAVLCRSCRSNLEPSSREIIEELPAFEIISSVAKRQK